MRDLAALVLAAGDVERAEALEERAKRFDVLARREEANRRRQAAAQATPTGS